MCNIVTSFVFGTSSACRKINQNETKIKQWCQCSKPRSRAPLQKAVALGWRGGLVVGRQTCDLRVAGSRPGRDAAAQQP